MNISRKELMRSCCVLAMSVVSFPACAQPDTTAPASTLESAQVTGTARKPDNSTQDVTGGSDLGEIVVTANKREEKLNNVGITITAISRQALIERKIDSLQDVAQAVPGLSFARSADNTPILTLRGVGFNETSLGVYPAVSVYIDQAPLPFPVLATHSGFDLERIEVLKGPQGTLFGQNSTGGAINFIAAKPKDRFEAGGDVSYGRFNQIDGNAYISGPVTDTLRARVAVTGLNSDGWQTSNTRPYDRNGKQSYVAGRLLMDWDAADTIHLSLNVNGWKDKSQPEAGQFILLNPLHPTFVLPQELAYPFSPETPRASDWSTGDLTPRSDRTFLQTAFRADIDLPHDLTLTSLTSYIRFHQRQSSDNDGSSLNIADLARDNGRITSLNQEIRLTSSPRSPFRWVAGGNYEDSRTFEDELLRYADDSANTPALHFISSSDATNRQRIKNYAFFANTEYDVLPKLTVKAGARYTRSRNSAAICQFDTGDGHLNNEFNFLGGLLGTAPFTPVANDVPPDQRCVTLNANNVPGARPFVSTLDQHNVSWRAGLDYHAGDNALLYANVSRGYKAGSFPSLAASTISQYQAVTQERLTSYEAGLKTALWDRKIEFDAAAFYYAYNNKQIRGKRLDPLFGALDVLINVPKSRVLGAEGELTLRPLSGLSLTGNVTYLNSKILRYSGVNVLGKSADFSGDDLPFTPRWNYSLGADYRTKLSDGGEPFIGLSVMGQSRSDTVVGGNDLVIPAGPGVRVLPGLVHPFTIKAYALVDARVGYEAPGAGWRVSVWAKNIFNKYYWTNVDTASDAGARFAGAPATYGLTFGVKFN